MLTPAVCTSCGKPIGHFVTIFRRIRENRTKQKMGDTLPEYASIDGQFVVQMGDVLDNLGITMECCRTIMTTDLPLRDTY